MVSGVLRRLSVVLAVVAVSASAIQVRATLITDFNIGVLGDSYSAEYTGGRSQHRSWVQQIDLAYGGNLFGSGGDNFLFNKAVSGAFLDTPAGYSGFNSILDSQLPALQTHLAGGVPEIVVLFGGANDFFPAYDSGVIAATIGPTILPNIQSIVSGILTGNANTKIVIVDVLARSSWPNNALPPFPDPNPNADVAAATSAANSALESWAITQGIPVVRARELQELGVDHTSHDLTLAGLDIAVGTTSDNQSPDSWFADGGHGSTIYQGALANTILTALDLGYGINSTLLDWHNDIFDLVYADDLNPATNTPAGLDINEFIHDGQSFTFSFADYVVVPEPATAMLLALGALLGLRRSRRAA